MNIAKNSFMRCETSLAKSLAEVSFDDIPNANKKSVSELKQHSQYAYLAKDCAKNEGVEFAHDYERLKTFENSATGFSGTVYRNINNDEIVVSYRCTANQLGVKSDIQMVENELPEQFFDAIWLYNKIKEEYPNSKITLTGHSLGASLAQLVASSDSTTQAVTFEGFGTEKLIKTHNLCDYKNTINYTTSDSVVSSFSRHPGETRTIYAHKILENQDKLLAPKSAPIVKEKHSIDNFTDLENAEFSIEFFEEQKRASREDGVIPFAYLALKANPNLKEELPKVFFKEDAC